MQAAVTSGPQQIGIERLPLPEPGPGEVRVRVRACGVCGSDLHLFGSGFFAPGTTPGHEIAGEVDALGDGVEGPKPGDLVAVEPLHSCGTCRICQQGLDAICREAQIHGIHRPGGFAEYLTVPARRLFPVPAHLDPTVAALSEPMAVVVHGLRRGNLAEGQRVLVVGAGSVGLLAVVAARALGAGDVWLTARHPHQAKLGEHLGATRVLSEAEASTAELDRLGREAPIDLVIETVGGSADTLNAAAAAVCPGGTISVVGVFMNRMTLDAMPLFVKESTLAWSNCYAHPHEGADFETAIELVAANCDALAATNTHGVPLDEIERAFALASDKKSGAVKVTVLP
jgi:2-desacetyl-2-hydroxyethyl bacteriochlorophyllide A dehydrogenase